MADVGLDIDQLWLMPCAATCEDGNWEECGGLSGGLNCVAEDMRCQKEREFWLATQCQNIDGQRRL